MVFAESSKQDMDLVLNQIHDHNEWVFFLEVTEYFNQFKSRVRQHAAELEAKLKEKEELFYESQRLDVGKRKKLGTHESVQKLARKIELVLKSIEDKFKQLEEVESMERATEDHQLQQAVDLMEISVNNDHQLREQVEQKEELEKGFDQEFAKDFELKEKQLEEQRKVLKEREKHYEKRLEQVKKKYENRFKELELKEQKLDELATNVKTAAAGGKPPASLQQPASSSTVPASLHSYQRRPMNSMITEGRFQQRPGFPPIPLIPPVYGAQARPKQQVVQTLEQLTESYYGTPQRCHNFITFPPGYEVQPRPQQQPVSLNFCSMQPRPEQRVVQPSPEIDYVPSQHPGSSNLYSMQTRPEQQPGYSKATINPGGFVI